MRKEENMTCRRFRKDLIPWLDGELKPVRAAELEAWLASCDKVRQCSVCRKLTAEYRSFHKAFQSTPQTEFPAHLHHRIMDKIKTEEVIIHRKEVRARWQTIPATIAILLSLGFGSLIGVTTFSNHNKTTINSELYTFGENGMVSTLNSDGGTE